MVSYPSEFAKGGCFMADNSNMMKVIIGIAIVVVLVLLFRGMKGTSPAPGAPGAPAAPSAPGAQVEQPGAAVPSAPTVAPTAPATTAAVEVGTKGLELVTNVRCDLAARTVSFTFTNGEDKPLKIHTGELMQLTPNSEYNFVRLGVNGRWANTNWDRTISCGSMELQSGATTECTMGGTVLRSPEQANELTGMHGQNVLTASNMNSAYKNYNDLDYFTCA